MTDIKVKSLDWAEVKGFRGPKLIGFSPFGEFCRFDLNGQMKEAVTAWKELQQIKYETTILGQLVNEEAKKAELVALKNEYRDLRYYVQTFEDRDVLKHGATLAERYERMAEISRLLDKGSKT